MKQHYIYKITNLINNKIYIGVRTANNPYKDVDYMGSCVPLLNEIKLNGIHNYKKEILFLFETREKAELKEAELVDKKFVIREDTYNGATGGVMGAPLSNLRKDIWDNSKKIINEYINGKSAEELSRLYNCDASLIRRVVRDVKRTQSGSNKLTRKKYRSAIVRKDVEQQTGQIIEEYNTGDGVFVLAKRYNCHPSVISRILTQNNVKKRNPSESQKSRKDLKQKKRQDLWDNKEKICMLRKQGISASRLGEMFNTSDTMIRKILKS